MQYKRMRHASRVTRHALRKQRPRVGRVMREFEREVAQVPDSGRSALLELIAPTKRILSKV